MLKRIEVNKIKLGIYICEFCGSWIEHPFSKKHFLLTDEKDLQAIQNSSIKELWIDTDLGADIEGDHLAKLKQEVEEETEYLLNYVGHSRPLGKSAFQDEIKLAAKVCSASKAAVISMFKDARLGNAIEVDAAQQVVEEIANSIMRNSHALISLARLKTADEYTYMHSVAVCALMIALARQLNLPEPSVRDAGLAGLLHDLGKIGIPDNILNKQLSNPIRKLVQKFY
jgi:HD-GYP domain-containing protein (c-di-GMP phosphodiesterase class II)